MPVYVDQARNGLGRMICCHMVADTLAELHAMADAIGMRRAWFQERGRFPHYDVSLTRRRLAVQLGAIEVDRRQLVQVMRRVRACQLADPAARAAAAGGQGTNRERSVKV